MTGHRLAGDIAGNFVCLSRASEMAQRRSEPDSDPVVAAIERVLHAERAAEQKLTDCRERAQAILAAARDCAAAITRRADARISSVHTAYLHKVQAELASLRAPSAVADSGQSRDGTAALQAAAARVAAQLTGDDCEPSL
jgi:vacuolar-type H+-ATPase subunit H